MDKSNNVPRWSSYRYQLAYIGFFGSTCMYLLRINFSVAIVCMTYDPVDNSSAAENVTSGIFAEYDRHKSLTYRYTGQNEDDCPNDENSTSPQTGEFDWNRSLRGTLSSSFFWGYIMTQILGGWLSQRVGGKRVLAAGVAVAIVSTFLSSPAARLSPYALLAIRFINGAGQGVFFPAYYLISGYWFPVIEHALLLAIFGTGSIFGSLLSFALSGVLCAELGWPWVFWIYGIACSLWLVIWILFAYDNPSDHPNISLAEREYIEATLTKRGIKMPAIPWKHMLTDSALWGVVVVDFCQGWAINAGLTQLPQYMEDVLQFDIRKNGLYSSLPQFAKFFTAFVFAFSGDYLIKHEKLKVLTVRKIMASFGFLLPMCFVMGVGYLNCNEAALAIALIVLQEAFNAAVRTGHMASRVDMAPRFAGIVTGICNSSDSVAAILAPIAIGEITTDGSRAQWQTVFFMSAAMYLTAWISFMIFGKSDVREWAKVKDTGQVDEDPGVQSSKVTANGVEYKNTNKVSYSNGLNENMETTYM